MPDLRGSGALVQVVLLPSAAFLKSLREKGSNEEEKRRIPYKGMMLIDTGASMSMIDKEVAEVLKLKHRGVTKIITPSTTEKDTPQECLTYDIDIMLENGVYFENIEVIAGEFKKTQGHNGLIGRDILKHALLVYHGYSGQFTLAI